MKTGPLFPLIYNCKKKTIILQGGGDAGKTVTALQNLAIDSIERKNYLTTITGQDVPNIKAGVLNSFENYVLSDSNISKYIKTYNKSERIFTWYNRSRTEFKSFENEQDARGSERDALFMNELNSFTYSLFWQLWRKTRRRVIADYNPSSRFFVHEKILPGPNQENMFKDQVQLYIVDHRHNPFLSQVDHDNYEKISDPELFRVYSRGLTGKITGLIFGHFRQIQPHEWPEKPDRVIYGIDYGYSSDQTAIVKIAVVGRKRYVKELYYETGSNAELIDTILRTNGWSEGQDIYSEADPNMVNQLRILRLPVVPAIKGPGSLAAGISKVKQYECFYTSDSPNLEKELYNYQWTTAQDIVTGKEIVTNVPKAGWDHLCDATRYAIYSDSFKYRSS